MWQKLKETVKEVWNRGWAHKAALLALAVIIVLSVAHGLQELEKYVG